MHKPLHDRVIVKVDAQESSMAKSSGGLFMPSYGEETPIKQATVLAVGDGEILYDGKIRRLAVSKGDRVLVNTNDVVSIDPPVPSSEPITGIISERQILAIVEA